MADSALSVILTSGTLSPMSSFQSELGVQFGTSLEAPHVINVDSQLWTGVIHTGPDNYPLNASYKTAESYGFQDALGTSLEQICKVVPGGCLVFFPSYKLVDKLRSRWSQTGQWSRLNAQKPVFVEPRAQDEFEHVLKNYYDTIRHGNKPITGRRRGKKWDAKCCNATKSKGNSKGATLLAVCRGKISEGIDFSDENARAVIIVGIPFPNVFDIQVAEKKKYNDTYKSSKGLLSGSEWYCQQAFRALNQAAGRCIRHRFDYGAIIFLDERFRQEKNLNYISKWIRKSIRQHDNFDQSIEGLKSFYRDIKVEKNASSMQQPIDEVVDVEEPRNWFTDMKNNKVTKPSFNGQRSMSDGVAAPEIVTRMKNFAVRKTEYDCSLAPKESKDQEVKPFNKSNNNTGISYADLKDDLDTQNRCLHIISSPNDFEVTVVKETSRNNDPEPLTVMETPIKETCSATIESELSKSTISHTKFPDSQLLPQSSCSTSASGCMHSFVTPNNQHIPQNRSPLLDLSVNSRFPKRRKASVVKMEPLGSPAQSCISETSLTTFGDVLREDVKISCSLCKYSLGLEENNYIVPCSLKSLSMVHLASIWKGKLEEAEMGPTSVPVMVSDVTSVDIRISSEQGIWSKEDGCVFNKVFCNFCSNQQNCLGLHVVATDSSNVQFLNKVLFYSDRLEIQLIDVLSSKEVSPPSVTSVTKSRILPQFEKYAYVRPETNSGGWRTTKSKMQLPKKVQISSANQSENTKPILLTTMINFEED